MFPLVQPELMTCACKNAKLVQHVSLQNRAYIAIPSVRVKCSVEMVIPQMMFNATLKPDGQVVLKKKEKQMTPMQWPHYGQHKLKPMHKP